MQKYETDTHESCVSVFLIRIDVKTSDNFDEIFNEKQQDDTFNFDSNLDENIDDLFIDEALDEE